MSEPQNVTGPKEGAAIRAQQYRELARLALELSDVFDTIATDGTADIAGKGMAQTVDEFMNLSAELLEVMLIAKQLGRMRMRGMDLGPESGL